MATYIEPILAMSGTMIEDAPSVAGHLYGVGMMGLRDDALVSDIVSAEGDWVFPRFSRQGALHTSGIMYVPNGLTVSTMPTVTVTGSVTANAGTNLNTSLLALESGGNLATIASSLSVLDDWDETDRAKVNSIVGQAGVQGGSGTVSANTQRVVLATDVALPAGTNNIGDVDVLTLPSIPAGTNNIGDVDVLTLPSIPTGTNSIGDIRSITTSVVPGTGATHLGKARATALGSTDTGVAVYGIRDDVLSNLAEAEDAATPFRFNRIGQLHISGQVGIVGSASDGSIVDGVTPSIKATVFDYTNSNPLAVRLTDTAGDYIAAGAGTQYTEGTAFGGNAIGTAVLGRMDQLLSNQIGAGYVDDDPVPMRFDVSGSLWTRDLGLSRIISHAGMTSPVEALQVGGYNSTTGQLRKLRLDDNNYLLVNIGASAGTLTVNDDGIYTALTGLSAVGAGSNTDTFAMDLQRIGGIAVQSSAFGASAGLAVGGGNAHDAGSSTVNPVLIGGYASSASPTAVNADNDAVRAWYLRNGAQVVSLGTATGLLTSDTTNGLKVYLSSGADAALSDSFSNPTTTTVGSMGMVWGGTNWKRLIQVNQLVGSGGTDGAGVPAAGLSAKYDESPASMTDGNWGELRMNANRVLLISGDVRMVSSSIGDATLAEQQTQTGHLATIAGDTTDIETAVELIDDTVATLGTTTYSEATTKGLIVGALRRDADTTAVGTDNEIGPLQMDANGRLKCEVFSGANLSVDIAANSISLMTGSNFTTVFGTTSLVTTATLADDFLNTTDVLNTAALTYVFDGTNWDRLRGDSTNGALVNLGTNNDVVGSISHGTADSTAPVKIGIKAVSHKADPSPVAALAVTDWYANRSGVPFVMAGHPNIETSGVYITDAKTNFALLAFPSNVKTVITEIEALCDNANTVDVGVTVGFHASATPTGRGMILTHPGIAAGSGVVRGTGAGILGIGASAEKLLVSSEIPSTGSLRLLFSYYTITET